MYTAGTNTRLRKPRECMEFEHTQVARGNCTNCTRMRQHFYAIFRKIVHIMLSKHMVMLQIKNSDEVSGKQFANYKPEQNLFPTAGALLYPLSSLTGSFTFKNEHNSVVLSLYIV